MFVLFSILAVFVAIPTLLIMISDNVFESENLNENNEQLKDKNLTVDEALKILDENKKK